MNPPWKPTPEQIARAHNRTIPDIVAPGLRVLFCGINPSLYSGAVGHHFARPGNRFWPTLHAAGLTPRRFDPFEDRELLALGFGITNLVARSTGAADELTPAELVLGGEELGRLVALHRPKWVAFVGITAYRTAFRRPRARFGPQEESIGPSRLWVLPNPSGRNQSFSIGPFRDLARFLAEK
ncbi:G/U mismatch-specific DNA glycosylase [Tundrisphaera sp. TA3]|uniref:G/U mismatch-specific DNA glycosylase n=1 Tax=Tundrisphaera sp. TA3 TaxID=3435775 RepID=UPI003EB7AAD8